MVNFDLEEFAGNDSMSKEESCEQLKKSMNFKSKADYQKWLAFGHMHGAFKKTSGNTPVKIKGKTKKVKHNK